VWWFSFESWRSHGTTLLEHDIVRFGPVPLLLSAIWGVLFVAVFLASLYSSIPRKK